MRPFLSVCAGLTEVSRLQDQGNSRTSNFHITQWVRQPPPPPGGCAIRDTRRLSHGGRKGGREAHGPRKGQAPETLTAPPNPPHRPGSAAGRRAQLHHKEDWETVLLGPQEEETVHTAPSAALSPSSPQPPSPRPLTVTHTLPSSVLSRKTLFSTSYPSTSQRF